MSGHERKLVDLNAISPQNVTKKPTLLQVGLLGLAFFKIIAELVPAFKATHGRLNVVPVLVGITKYHSWCFVAANSLNRGDVHPGLNKVCDYSMSQNMGGYIL